MGSVDAAPAPSLRRYFSAVERVTGKSRPRFPQLLESLFDGVELRGRNVLDVGGGFGVCSFYAACRGARRVVCLEPEAAGGTADATRRFHELASLVEVDGVELSRSTLQEYDAKGETFDVVLLRNSINHLDEAACVALLRHPAARATYADICRRLADLTRPGGRLILTDCSRLNVYPLVGRRNPHVPTIEWEKHHRPRVWVTLLREAGFSNPKVGWRVPRTGPYARGLLKNGFVSFFLTSHFRIGMEKPARAG